MELEELNKMETSFLVSLGFRLVVQPRTFEKYRNILTEMTMEEKSCAVSLDT